ncbi:MAG: hypothetical protein IKP28_04695 [Clostridia bacterium]|nr:hypothetical protein [Clostridia bacterium]
MKKKLCYKVEDSVFIFRYMLYAAFALCIVAGIAGIIYSNFDISKFVEGIVISILFIPFISLPLFLIIFLINRKNVNEIKLVKNNGTKVQGNIVGWDKESSLIISHGLTGILLSAIFPNNSYYLYIEYYDLSNSLQRFKTPKLNFNPVWSLGDNKCSIYLYEDKVYATDFVKAKNISKRVFKDTPHGIN